MIVKGSLAGLDTGFPHLRRRNRAALAPAAMFERADSNRREHVPCCGSFPAAES